MHNTCICCQWGTKQQGRRKPLQECHKQMAAAAAAACLLLCLQAYEGWKQRREAKRLQKEADKAAKEVGG